MTAIRKQVVISEDHKLHLDMDVPDDIPVGEMEIVVTMIPRNSPNKNMDVAIAALGDIAARGNLTKAIPDPTEWQREIRKDRPLPGRDE